jgi:hypothetical protein
MQMLVQLTSKRDALALLELTRESHKERVRGRLVQVFLAIEDVTSALERWRLK